MKQLFLALTFFCSSLSFSLLAEDLDNKCKPKDWPLRTPQTEDGAPVRDFYLAVPLGGGSYDHFNLFVVNSTMAVPSKEKDPFFGATCQNVENYKRAKFWNGKIFQAGDWYDYEVSFQVDLKRPNKDEFGVFKIKRFCDGKIQAILDTSVHNVGIDSVNYELRTADNKESLAYVTTADDDELSVTLRDSEGILATATRNHNDGTIDTNYWHVQVTSENLDPMLVAYVLDAKENKGYQCKPPTPAPSPGATPPQTPGDSLGVSALLIGVGSCVLASAALVGLGCLVHKLRTVKVRESFPLLGNGHYFKW